ncbi:hypothetical protein M9458_053846 [Cirrhinus mrigala]|uniref:Oxysterol-binding protein-related protein 6 n=1 Tax=Cirrhinus mrigala TaxID=683832 RepID=A0ABD0MQA1_CIRMR
MADYRHPLGSSQSVSALDKSAVASAVKPTHSRNGSSGSSRHSRQNSRDWEVISDPECSASGVGMSTVSNTVPGICEGFLMKRRKYPLRGWHKIARGKIHGALDVSLAVMSVNKKSKRIDLDAGDSLYHVKAKSDDIFYIWLTKLTAHRHFKKNEAINLHQGVLEALSTGNGSTLPAMASLAQRNRVMMPHYQSSASLFGSEMQGSPSASSSRGNAKVSDWLKQTQDADLCQQELARCQLDLAELSSLVQKLHWHEGGLPTTNMDLERRISMQNLSLEKPKKKRIAWLCKFMTVFLV